ncbi:DUF742 domain-containing protein [Actinomadura decatromicini]|uniref:DUF742 domain-containing protein n=1 Tax=Actinomadura decatromicini TaxID=2604572 RepID=A0A5D3FAD8_9ACTN|nr:DUF742 domain-containing protein [Actinomadura decatromicini]TYK45917.1 DUF742 domain-containing protein [Actinomadura decatromicini]
MDRGSPFGGGPGGPGRWPGDPQGRTPAQGRPPERDDDPNASSSLVRPYAVTGGRTKPRYDLAIEALVTAAPYPPRDVAVLTPEYRAIMDLCRSARSVAEVSALLRLPLGVARVLIADMAVEGLLRLHQSQPATTAGGQPDLRLLERVLSGLRKL